MIAIITRHRPLASSETIETIGGIVFAGSRANSSALSEKLSAARQSPSRSLMAAAGNNQGMGDAQWPMR